MRESLLIELRQALIADSARHAFAKRLGAEFVDVLEHLETVRVMALRAMPYEAYLKTEHWRRVAARAKELAGGRCQLCNATGPLDAHHRTYERRGCEADGDVTVLCPKCHKHFHTPEAEPILAASDDTANPATEAEQCKAFNELIARRRMEQGLDPRTGERLGGPSMIRPLSATLSGR